MAINIRSNYGGINTGHLVPAYSDIVVYAEGIAQSTIDNFFNVKYICLVVIDGTTVATLKAPPVVDADSAINNKAFFRVQSIIQDFTETDKRNFESITAPSKFEGLSLKPHSIHQIDKYARNKSNFRRVGLVGGFEYSTTQGGTIIQSTSIGGLEFNVWNAVYQHNQGYDVVTPDEHILDGGTKKFLTKFPATFSTRQGQKIQLQQYHTIGFFNGKVYGADETENSLVAKMKIVTFDANNSALNTYNIDNTNSNGGYDDGLDRSENKLLYFGIGTGNLSNSGVDFTNVDHYTVEALDKDDNTTSARYFFNIQQADCKGYETIRLAFLNSKGAYDYYNFTKKSIRKQQITKSPIKQNYGYALGSSVYGDFADLINSPIYEQGTYDGGTRTYNVNAVETIDANTEFITEDEAAILEELFLSPDVYMQNGERFEPVVINETEYIKQTSSNDKLIQYLITIEKAHNTRVQRL